MSESQDFYYEADTTSPLSTEVVMAVAKAQDRDAIDQTWQIRDDINTDALDGLFRDETLEATLQFEADTMTVTIIADGGGDSVIKIKCY